MEFCLAIARTLACREEASLSLSEKTLFDEFEIRGTWWLTSDPEREIPGKLKCSPARIKLELDGRMGKGEEDDDSLRRVLIHGVGTGGEAFSLLDCFESAFNITFGYGHQTSEFISNVVAMGDHIAGIDDLLTTTASLYVHGLDESFDRPKYDMNRNGSNYSLSVAKPEKFEVYIPSIKTTVSIDMLTDPAFSQRTIEISPGAFILIKADAPIPFADLRATLFSITDFFTVLGCYPSPALRIGTGAAQDDSSVFSLYFRQNCAIQPSTPSPDDLLVKFSELDSEVRTRMLNNWFSLDDQAKLAQHWTTTIMTTPTSFNQLDFVHLSHGLESLHSSFCGSKYMLKKDFKAVVDAMCAAIPDTVSEDHRVKLINQVRYGNEYDLRTRLKELISKLPGVLRSELITDIDRFAGSVVATRNANTHLSTEEKKMVIDDALLPAANDGLKILFCLSLLNHIGVPENVLKAGLERSNIFRSFSYRRPW